MHGLKNAKFIILEIDDLRYVDEEDLKQLRELMIRIEISRASRKKSRVGEYYICSSAEPYAPAVADAILSGEYHKKHPLDCYQIVRRYHGRKAGAHKQGRLSDDDLCL